MEFLKMSNRTYDILKWFGQIVIPALITLFGVIGNVLDIPRTESILAILIAFNTCWNSILGISTIKYNSINKE